MVLHVLLCCVSCLSVGVAFWPVLAPTQLLAPLCTWNAWAQLDQEHEGARQDTSRMHHQTDIVKVMRCKEAGLAARQSVSCLPACVFCQPFWARTHRYVCVWYGTCSKQQGDEWKAHTSLIALPIAPPTTTTRRTKFSPLPSITTR
uniref:Secreted protein n=1 Tax=Vitrella brassicaformis TaxID=1169539 RepID=A0A7S1JMV8_9ALVE|mmetsp:Transcript_16048/g.38310  ORF Transcript_16048/g.38310 Transcript_16048/m.38310 type:complete len:146 (+) Transcript_16048:347-784(+)